MFGVSVWCSVCRDFGDGGAGGGFVDDGLVGGECAGRVRRRQTLAGSQCRTNEARRLPAPSVFPTDVSGVGRVDACLRFGPLHVSRQASKWPAAVRVVEAHDTSGTWWCCAANDSKSPASITASRRCSRATPLTIGRCEHVTALISGTRSLTGSLRLFPQSRDRLEQVAIPPPPTAAARNSTQLISPKSNGK